MLYRYLVYGVLWLPMAAAAQDLREFAFSEATDGASYRVFSNFPNSDTSLPPDDGTYLSYYAHFEARFATRQEWAGAAKYIRDNFLKPADELGLRLAAFQTGGVSSRRPSVLRMDFLLESIDATDSANEIARQFFTDHGKLFVPGSGAYLQSHEIKSMAVTNEVCAGLTKLDFLTASFRCSGYTYDERFAMKLKKIHSSNPIPVASIRAYADFAKRMTTAINTTNGVDFLRNLGLLLNTSPDLSEFLATQIAMSNVLFIKPLFTGILAGGQHFTFTIPRAFSVGRDCRETNESKMCRVISGS